MLGCTIFKVVLDHDSAIASSDRTLAQQCLIFVAQSCMLDVEVKHALFSVLQLLLIDLRIMLTEHLFVRVYLSAVLVLHLDMKLIHPT